MATASRKQNSELAVIFQPILDDLAVIRDQITARRDHLLKKQFEQSLKSTPELAKAYATSALKIGTASKYQATKIQVKSMKASRLLEARKLFKTSVKLQILAKELFEAVQRELALWAVLNETIWALRSPDKKIAAYAVSTIPSLKDELTTVFAEELKIVDGIVELSKKGESAA